MGTDRVGEFEERFDALAVVAHRVAYRLLGDREAAQDVAQEALTRAFVRWRRIEGYAEPWVARVAANLALGQLRRRRPIQPRLEVDARHSERATDGVLQRAVLADALARLPHRQRDVVVLRYLADLPEAEVAVLLGCAPGTVKSHAHRALGTLRTQLGDPTLLTAGGTP